MAEIISINKINSLCRNLKKQGKVIVLAGGCFDVLHPGHVIFLEKAKSVGDILIVLLESDQSVKKLKGKDRPVHSQKMRAKVLSALEAVDFVLLLPTATSQEIYEQTIDQIKPDIIAITKGYADIKYHKRSAKMTGAKLVYVTNMIGNFSTSRILNR